MPRPWKKKKRGKKNEVHLLPGSSRASLLNILSDLKWAARAMCNICASLNYNASGERVAQARGWQSREEGGWIQREKHQVGGTASPVTRGASDVPSGKHIKAEGQILQFASRGSQNTFFFLLITVSNMLKREYGFIIYSAYSYKRVLELESLDYSAELHLTAV